VAYFAWLNGEATARYNTIRNTIPTHSGISCGIHHPKRVWCRIMAIKLHRNVKNRMAPSTPTIGLRTPFNKWDE